jgi:uncharacterized protein (TIGR00297 family)
MPPKAGRKREAWAWGLSVALLVVELVWTGLNWRIFLRPVQHCVLALAISFTFAVLVFVLRGATISGAFAGFVVAFGFSIDWGISNLPPLIALFVLTWAATAAHSRKNGRKPHPRDGTQVLANIGLAPVLYLWGPGLWAATALLAEATADTVASEVGQAFGGKPRLITTMRRVPIGTNGAITLLGTAAGLIAAVVVALTVEVRTLPFWSLFWRVVSATTVAAMAGMVLDSVLGATLEPRILQNDGINFVSTLFTAIVAPLLLHWLVPLVLY